VLAEYGDDYFFNFVNSPFMTRRYQVKSARQRDIPAAVHAKTSRAQSVDKSFYAPFRRLLEQFYTMTGVPMVLNTSLNRHNEPIVHTPIEAIGLLLSTDLDELVIGSFGIRKPQHN
jgi:carbamoyltransferase